MPGQIIDRFYVDAREARNDPVTLPRWTIKGTKILSGSLSLALVFSASADAVVRGIDLGRAGSAAAAWELAGIDFVV